VYYIAAVIVIYIRKTYTWKTSHVFSKHFVKAYIKGIRVYNSRGCSLHQYSIPVYESLVRVDFSLATYFYFGHGSAIIIIIIITMNAIIRACRRRWKMNFAGSGVFQSYFTGAVHSTVTTERPTAGMIDLSWMIDVMRTKAIQDFRLAWNGCHTCKYVRVQRNGTVRFLNSRRLFYYRPNWPATTCARDIIYPIKCI